MQKAKPKNATSEADPSVVKARGAYADVHLFGEAMEEFEALGPKTDEKSVQKHRHISRYFERFAELGPTSLNDKMFKKQQRINSRGTDVLIHEFKAHQFRIYGVVCEFNGKRCFLGFSCDPDKKKDKADPKKLQKAADEYVRICHG